MPQKDEIIKDYQISCNTFSDFYKKAFLSNSTTKLNNENLIMNFNAQFFYTLNLLEKSLKKTFFGVTLLQKSILVQRSYEEIGVLLSNCNNENNNLIFSNLNTSEFYNIYLSKTKEIIRGIATKEISQLQKYAVKHKFYGDLNILELIFLTSQLNYIAIYKYKNLLCEDYYKVA
jgi:hypothetical protein